MMDRWTVALGRRVFLTTFVAVNALTFSTLAPATADPSAPAGTASLGLKQYVLPDHTASVMLPQNWKVTQTGVALIEAQGPNGEMAMFGILIPAHDGSATSITPTVLNQPYSAGAKDKFTQSLNWVRTRNGKGAVPVDFKSETPIKNAPTAFGNCSNLTALVGDASQGQVAVEADLCSMPVDSAGNYKNFFKVVGVSAGLAAQERSSLEAILGSYQINSAALAQVQKAGSAPKTGAGATATATAPGKSAAANSSALTWAQAIAQVNAMKQASAITNMKANAINAATMNSMIGSTNAANNFDMGVLRGDTPVYAVGQSQPLFWLGN
ncbi:MAG TPA: hypothetical protein VK727_15660 [Steroidobacteraceae bacterium]|jgi:hypothetical protein|nr:hypothetical protein [Steroidobacteraceae bacterium]